ncbi:hypothetical protein BDQ12DRAFT_765507 [Crucibulum laeve]|uniref:Uncharacterized protein n=1 Tax=Crucibulum laeve TaxID=68775 RepID=A0A5C3LNQ4_9AGAR|nr:hypothetical protein BDQ12DRAFT_765507 [Crucibulum laeve]
MMFEVLFLITIFITGILGQTVDVQFYDEEGCDNVGASCNALPADDCCGSPNFLWTSISTDNWQNVAAGTEVRAHSPQNGNICAILLVTIEEGECLINEVPDTISAAAFFNGSHRKRRRGVAGATEKCDKVHPIDEYFYQPGDGFRYIVDAKNATHAAAFNAVTSSSERAQYISANFDKKVVVKASKAVTKFTG